MTREGGPTQQQHSRMGALWRIAGITDRGDRIALTGAFVKRALSSSDDLTPDEAAEFIRYMGELDRRHLLVQRTHAWLNEHRPGAAARHPHTSRKAG